MNLVQEQSNLLNMSHVDLDEHLDSIVGKSGKERESVDIRLALHRYPELQGYLHYTGQVLMCSPEMNVFCDDILIEHYGEEHIALPYTYDAGVRIYSNPVIFYLGIDNPDGFGINPFNDWDKHFNDNCIDPKLIARVRDFLASHKPASYL